MSDLPFLFCLPALFRIGFRNALKVYSITSEESLAEAKLVADRLAEFTKIYNRSVIVVGNKTDLEIYRFQKNKNQLHFLSHKRFLIIHS